MRQLFECIMRLNKGEALWFWFSFFWNVLMFVQLFVCKFSLEKFCIVVLLILSNVGLQFEILYYSETRK